MAKRKISIDGFANNGVAASWLPSDPSSGETQFIIGCNEILQCLSNDAEVITCCGRRRLLPAASVWVTTTMTCSSLPEPLGPPAIKAPARSS